MLFAAVGRTCHGLESVEDQVSGDVGSIVQVSKPDLMARGVTLDLLQMAKRVGPQYEAAEYKDLSGEVDLPLDCVVVDDLWTIKLSGDGAAKLSTKAPVSVSKPADIGWGVQNCASKANGNRRRGDTMFTQVRSLSMKVIPYFLLF